MLPVILIAMFMAGFDIWAVNVAAPSLQRDLHVSDAALQLIVGGYAFMYASGMVTGGRLGDLFGYRRLFMIGVVTLRARLAGVRARPVRGRAGRLPAGPGADRRGDGPAGGRADHRDLPGPGAEPGAGFFGATMGLGFVSGQILGGGLIQANIFGLGWRAIFLVNVPVGVLALIAAAVVVPHGDAGSAGRGLTRSGAIGVSGGLALALVPLTLGRDEGWPVWTWVSLAAGAAGAGGHPRLGAAAHPPAAASRCSTWRSSATGRSRPACC